MRFSVFYPIAARDVDDLARLYDQALRVAERAEALGFHGFYFNEGHRWSENFRSPNPRLMIAAASQRTARLRLGAGLVILPVHDPRLVAEDAAMLDALTEGRLILGLGPGFQREELAEFGADPDARHEIFDAKLQALEAYLRGETVTADGPYVHAANAQVGARMRADYRARLYRGAVSRQGAAAIGESGYGLMLSPLERRTEYAERDGAALVGECCALHALGWTQSPQAHAPRPPVLMQVYAHVAESFDQVRAEAGDAFERFQLDVCRREPKGPHAYFDEYAANSASMIGDVATLRARAEALHAAGVAEILLMTNFGGRDEDAVVETLARFAVQVMGPLAHEQARQRPQPSEAGGARLHAGAA